MSAPITFPINLPNVAKKNLGQQIKFQDPFFLAMPFYGYKAFSCRPGENGTPPWARIQAVQKADLDEQLRLIKPAATDNKDFVSFGTAKGVAIELFKWSIPEQKDYIGIQQSPLDGTLALPVSPNLDNGKWDLYSLEYPDDDRPLCYGDLIVLKNKANGNLLSATDTVANPPKVNAAAAGYNEIWIILCA